MQTCISNFELRVARLHLKFEVGKWASRSAHVLSVMKHLSDKQDYHHLVVGIYTTTFLLDMTDDILTYVQVEQCQAAIQPSKERSILQITQEVV